ACPHGAGGALRRAAGHLPVPGHAHGRCVRAGAGRRHDRVMSNDDLIAALAELTEEQVYDLLDSLPEPAARALLDALPASQADLPASPLAQAIELDDGYRPRPHLEYLAERLEQAVRDVENGVSRRIAISM